MTWATEAEMVADFVERVKSARANPWTVYPETAGWDLLLAHKDGYQLGVEAKLSLNAKVIDQALSGLGRHWHDTGPDYRAVLVPSGKVQLHLGRICSAIGIGVIAAKKERFWSPNLPNQEFDWRDWPNWCPARRCALPDYIPDVEAGHSAPVMLTKWKIMAIKLSIILERRGYVTRADMKSLGISPTRWTDHWNGFLARDPHRKAYVRSERTPDLRSQHPINWSQIEADIGVWGKEFGLGEVA